MPTPSAKRPRKSKSLPAKSATRKPTSTTAPRRKRGLSINAVTTRGFSATAPQSLLSRGLEEASAPDAQLLDVNMPGLGRNAANAMERHRALHHAVTGVWAVEDIAALRRVEGTGSFKWVMWRRSSLPPAWFGSHDRHEFP